MIREEMERLVAGAPSISEKIRILHDAGVKTADISRFVERRYQQVRNVLLDYEKKKTRMAGEGSPASPPEDGSEILHMELGKDGKIKLPQAWLDNQGLRAGDPIICRADADGLRVMSREAAIRTLAEIARRRMPQEAALMEALLRKA